MKPFYQDNDTTLFNGDCRNMSDLEDGSVQCVVTSPPYWGLRKYAGVPDLIWGGDSLCSHEWGTAIKVTGTSRWDTFVKTDGSRAKAEYSETESDNHGAFCQLCGAWRGSYGLEPTPDCGRPFAKLRDDLTEKERAYVMAELEKWGLL